MSASASTPTSDPDVWEIVADAAATYSETAA
jgi:hypothetical protein